LYITEFLKENKVTILLHPDLAHVTFHISYNKKELSKLNGRKFDKIEKLVRKLSIIFQKMIIVNLFGSDKES
jgi:hypothetical protein